MSIDKFDKFETEKPISDEKLNSVGFAKFIFDYPNKDLPRTIRELYNEYKETLPKK